MRLGDMTMVTWISGLHFQKAPFTLYIRLAGCMQLSSTAFKRERDTGRLLAENCEHFYTHAYLAPPMGMITRHNFRKKTVCNLVHQACNNGAMRVEKPWWHIKPLFCSVYNCDRRTDGIASAKWANIALSTASRGKKNTRVDTIQNYYNSCRQWRCQLVGTCPPPWRLRNFFSLYVETSCLVWFGTIPNS